MGCMAVCAGAGALDGVFAVALTALAFTAALALAVAVVSVLAGYAWALAVAVAVANVAMGWALVRVYRYGPTLEVFRRHRRTHQAALPAPVRQTALPRGTHLAIAAPSRVIPGVVLDDVHERTEAVDAVNALPAPGRLTAVGEEETG